jgi:ClpA/ClpB-like protein
MFERYTEKARRVIFFARYEASQFGNPYIETEHLLLGLLREDKALRNRLSRLHVSAESIRKQIEARTPVRGKVSTSVDLPLSQECKRVLGFAAQEAERLAHKHIGTEHLLLGLLMEEKCFAAEILHERGLRASTIREELASAAPPEVETAPSSVIKLSREAVCKIRMDAWCQRFHWERRPCVPQDALKHRESGRISFHHGQSYDAAEFESVKAGWTHYHCIICWRSLFEGKDADTSFGYTNGQDWLCPDCYRAFVSEEG